MDAKKYLEPTIVTGMNCEFEEEIPMVDLLQTMGISEQGQEIVLKYFGPTVNQLLEYQLKDKATYDEKLELAEWKCKEFVVEEFEFKLQAVQFICTFATHYFIFFASVNTNCILQRVKNISIVEIVSEDKQDVKELIAVIDKWKFTHVTIDNWASNRQQWFQCMLNRFGATESNIFEFQQTTNKESTWDTLIVALIAQIDTLLNQTESILEAYISGSRKVFESILYIWYHLELCKHQYVPHPFFESTLGVGGYGEVHLCKHGNGYVAVKRIISVDTQMIAQVKDNEIVNEIYMTKYAKL